MKCYQKGCKQKNRMWKMWKHPRHIFVKLHVLPTGGSYHVSGEGFFGRGGWTGSKEGRIFEHTCRQLEEIKESYLEQFFSQNVSVEIRDYPNWCVFGPFVSLELTEDNRSHRNATGKMSSFVTQKRPQHVQGRTCFTVKWVGSCNALWELWGGKFLKQGASSLVPTLCCLWK